MSTLQNLRDLLAGAKFHLNPSSASDEVIALLEILPQFIKEYEGFEREAKAGNEIKKRLNLDVHTYDKTMEVFSECREYGEGYAQAYAELRRTYDHAYREACEGDK